MERRDFIKLCSMTGLAVVAGNASKSQVAHAGQGGSKNMPLLLTVHANGGWDVTNIIDPKGYLPGDGVPTGQAGFGGMNKYPNSAIPQAGNIRYAPVWMSPDVANNAQVMTAAQTAIPAFWNKWYSRITVINGIDSQTNSHDTGTRAQWSGTLRDQTPNVAALVAATHLPSAPMAMIDAGGFADTAGTVVAARTANTDVFRRVAYPNRINADDDNAILPKDIRQFQTDNARAIIAEARKEQYEAFKKSQRLPRLRDAADKLFVSRLGSNELNLLLEFMPQNVPQGLAGRAAIVMAAYKAGLAMSASLSLPGGYDMHGDVDAGLANNLPDVYTELDQLYTLSEQMGVSDNILVICGSDFGRTPFYNDGNGKDHWSITSNFIWGAVRGTPIPGDRVIGSTTHEHEPIPVNKDTLAEDPSGVIIKHAHMQRAIRDLYEVSPDLDQQFPSEEKQKLNLFGI